MDHCEAPLLDALAVFEDGNDPGSVVVEADKRRRRKSVWQVRPRGDLPSNLGVALVLGG
jgi:hypothetical protein